VLGLLRVLVKVVLASAIVLLALLLIGEFLRQIVPVPYHRTLWKTGLVIFFPCLLGIVLTAQSPTAKWRRLQHLVIVGAFTGAVLFVLFITDVECALTPKARGGMNLSCQYFGEP
jgi:hypothetical protein